MNSAARTQAPWLFQDVDLNRRTVHDRENVLTLLVLWWPPTS